MNTKTISLLTAAVLFLSALYIASLMPQLTAGSVIVGSEYNATSTAASGVYGAQTAGNKVIKTGYGSIGSVIITGANTGAINLYNATTTNVALRTGNTPTSTILIASIPASTAAGTYVFDVAFNHGLLLDLVSGIMPTTTITWR